VNATRAVSSNLESDHSQIGNNLPPIDNRKEQAEAHLVIPDDVSDAHEGFG